MDFLFPSKKEKNLIILIAKNRNTYLTKLLISTFWIGFITFIINWVYIKSPFHIYKIDGAIYSLVGFVIALVLVFRTNTSYDRWWEGKKMLTDLTRISRELKNQVLCSDLNPDIISEIRAAINYFFIFLKSGKSIDRNMVFKKYDKLYLSLFSKSDDRNRATISKLLSEMGSAFYTGERIKETPIPIAYSIHIKVCIFAYLLSMPFGTFYSMGIYSTYMVMILYFLIAGIEIISTEIEDPFAGDPNDLPLDIIEKDINKILNNKNYGN